MKRLGAAYLAHLGLRALVDAVRGTVDGAAESAAGGAAPARGRAALQQGPLPRVAARLVSERRPA